MGMLEGKLAIVTGGAGAGIGHGISTVMAAEGAHVAIMEIDVESAKVLQQRIESSGGRASVLRADISKAEEVRWAVEEVVRRHQRVDILVNSAGVGLVRPLAEVTEEEFDQLVSIDLRGMWLCCKYAIPHMQRQKNGAIVNIASVHSRATLPGFGAYAALKAGVGGLTRGIAVQYGTDGIRANAVCPGVVDEDRRRNCGQAHARGQRFGSIVTCNGTKPFPNSFNLRMLGGSSLFCRAIGRAPLPELEIPIDGGTWARSRAAIEGDCVQLQLGKSKLSVQAKHTNT